MGTSKKNSHDDLIKLITGGQPTHSLKDVMSYADMQQFNQDAATDRLKAKRKAASSQRKAAQIILNA